MIIFFGLIYNLYLYQQEESTNCKTQISMANVIGLSDQMILKDSSSTEIIKSLK